MGVVVSVKGATAQKILKAAQGSADPQVVKREAASAQKLMEMLNKK